MNVNKKLGERIRLLRKARHWSILDLALNADINPNYLGDLENGRRNPTLVVLYKISSALNVSLSALFLNVDRRDS